MLRVLLALLVLANGLLAAWGMGWLGGRPGSDQREPGRLGQQIEPDKLQWLSAAQLAQQNQALPVCREVGPLIDAAAVARAREQLQALGVRELQAVVVPVPGEWVIATRPAESPAEVTRKQYVLDKAGLDGIKTVKLPNENNPSWVVKHFDQRAQAQAELTRLRAQGLRALRLVTLREASGTTWLRAAQWPTAQAQSSHEAWPGKPRACEAQAASGPDAAASQHASSPSAASAAANQAVVKPLVNRPPAAGAAASAAPAPSAAEPVRAPASQSG